MGITKNVIVNFTVSWFVRHPNWMEWFRTIYFSLFGATLLNLIINLPTLLNYSLTTFIAGVVVFFIGCWSTAEIISRFKRYEVEYERMSQEEMKDKTIDVYYCEKEIKDKSIGQIRKISFQHVSFYFSWIIAIVLILISIIIEHRSDDIDFEIISRITKIESHTKRLDSLLDIIESNSSNQHDIKHQLDIISKKIDWQSGQIDSIVRSGY